MYLGKKTNGTMSLVECENGREVGGRRRQEKTLRRNGYKNAVLVERPSDTATQRWDEYPTMWMQVWEEEPAQGADVTGLSLRSV